MKKYYLITLSLILLIVYACNKDKSSGPATTTPPPVATSFVINGVADVNMDDSFAMQAVAVTYTSGTQEKTTISVSGLPTGMTATIDPESGTPTFGSVITYVAADAVKTGTYPLKITGTTASGAVKEYSFNLNYTNCTAAVKGVYAVTNPCAASNYKASITKDQIVTGRIDIENFAGTTVSVYADLDCGRKTLNIPSQPYYSGTISGTGTIGNDGTITFQYSIDGGSSCSATYSPFTDCASAVAKQYNATYSNRTANVYPILSGSTVNVYSNVDAVNQITIGDGYPLKANLNCAAKTLTIPAQSFISGPPTDVTGSGTFTNNTIKFTYYSFNHYNNAYDTCDVTLTLP